MIVQVTFESAGQNGKPLEEESEDWRAGYRDALLGNPITFPRRADQAGHRRTNREYNFGYGWGEKERKRLLRKLHTSVRKAIPRGIDL